MAGKDEGRMRKVVHHVHGQADRLGPRRHRNADVAGARAEDRDHAGEIGRQRIARRKLDPRRVGGIETAQIMMAIGRDTSERARRPRPAGAISPAPDRRAPTSSTGPACRSRNTGRNRMRYSLPRLPGLTGIIFYICLVQRSQRENYFFSIAAATIEFSPPDGQGPEMHLLDNDSVKTRCLVRQA